jgi:hypothetical protein
MALSPASIMPDRLASTPKCRGPLTSSPASWPWLSSTAMAGNPVLARLYRDYGGRWEVEQIDAAWVSSGQRSPARRALAAGPDGDSVSGQDARHRFTAAGGVAADIE